MESILIQLLICLSDCSVISLNPDVWDSLGIITLCSTLSFVNWSLYVSASNQTSNKGLDNHRLIADSAANF